jgi:hypothetical protein
MTVFFPEYKIKDVAIDSIDFADCDYKISKPLNDDKLKNSIQSFGLIDLPVLLKNNGKYQIICGHNRINILRELSDTKVTSYVLSELLPETYIRFAILKNFRREIGTIGKIKFIRLLKTKFFTNENDILTAAKAVFIPEDFFDITLSRKILNLPEALLNYIDIKEAGFKIIKNILRLPDEAFLLLSEWITLASIRVNIFKEIIDLIIDIYKRDGNLDSLDIDLALFGATIRKDEALYQQIFKIRYPEYTNIKLKADKIISAFKRTDLEIDFPFYSERDDIGLIFKIRKRDGIEHIKRTLDQIDLNGIRNLLELI